MSMALIDIKIVKVVNKGWTLKSFKHFCWSDFSQQFWQNLQLQQIPKVTKLPTEMSLQWLNKTSPQPSWPKMLKSQKRTYLHWHTKLEQKFTIFLRHFIVWYNWQLFFTSKNTITEQVASIIKLITEDTKVRHTNITTINKDN